MDLAFQNNQTFALSLDVNAWKPVYPLTVCVFHMQIRTAPTVVPVIYAWSSNPADQWGDGTITYTDSTGLLFFHAPYSDMVKLIPGNYVWDLELIFGTEFKVLTGGAFVVTAGITIQ